MGVSITSFPNLCISILCSTFLALFVLGKTCMWCFRYYTKPESLLHVARPQSDNLSCSFCQTIISLQEKYLNVCYGFHFPSTIWILHAMESPRKYIVCKMLAARKVGTPYTQPPPHQDLSPILMREEKPTSGRSTKNIWTLTPDSTTIL